MKNFILAIILFCSLGCKTNIKKFNSIEIIEYDWFLNSNMTAWKPIPYSYSQINPNGEALHYINENFAISNYTYSSSKFNKDIVKDFVAYSEKIDSSLSHSSPRQLLPGNIKRVKITYSDNSFITFNIQSGQKEEPLIKHVELYQQNNQFVDTLFRKKTQSPTKLDTSEIKQSFQRFLNFAIHQDSIQKRFPPALPHNKKIEFITK